MVFKFFGKKDKTSEEISNTLKRFKLKLNETLPDINVLEKHLTDLITIINKELNSNFAGCHIFYKSSLNDIEMFIKINNEDFILGSFSMINGQLNYLSFGYYQDCMLKNNNGYNSISSRILKSVTRTLTVHQDKLKQ